MDDPSFKMTFRPRGGLPRRLYDFVYTSIHYAIKNFSTDETKTAISGYQISWLIEAAARDAVDDVIAELRRKKKREAASNTNTGEEQWANEAQD